MKGLTINANKDNPQNFGNARTFEPNQANTRNFGSVKRALLRDGRVSWCYAGKKTLATIKNRHIQFMCDGFALKVFLLLWERE